MLSQELPLQLKFCADYFSHRPTYFHQSNPYEGPDVRSREPPLPRARRYKTLKWIARIFGP